VRRSLAEKGKKRPRQRRRRGAQQRRRGQDREEKGGEEGQHSHCGVLQPQPQQHVLHIISSDTQQSAVQEPSAQLAMLQEELYNILALLSFIANDVADHISIHCPVEGLMLPLNCYKWQHS
jgi:hypothetical protein